MAVAKEAQTWGGHRIHIKPAQMKQFPTIISHGNADSLELF